MNLIQVVGTFSPEEEARLRGAKAAVKQHPEFADKAVETVFVGLDTIKDYNDAFMQMSAGVYDAIAVDIGVAQYQLAANEGKYRILDEPLSKEQYAIAFAKGNTELRDMVQETLDEMAADGTVEKIVAGYAEYNLPDMLILGKE